MPLHYKDLPSLNPPTVPSEEFLVQQVTSPGIPAAGIQTATPLREQPGEQIATGTGQIPGATPQAPVQIDPATGQALVIQPQQAAQIAPGIGQAPVIQPKQAAQIATGIGQAPVVQPQQAAQIDPATGQVPISPAQEAAQGATQLVTQPTDITAAQVTAAQGEAAQGVVVPESTVRYQLEQLMQDVDDNRAPWANAAIRKVNSTMLARGMGGSSIAATAITTAVMESAIPIAQLDANIYGQINMQNLLNRQQSA